MQVTDKIAIITGAGSGIGRALAKRFAADGAQAIICADRSADDAAETAELIGKQASAAVLDVSDQEAIEAMVAKTEQDFGRVDILVSNAGYGQPGGLEKPTSDWKHMMDVHTWSHLNASRAVIPGMLERGSGYLLSTASAAGLLPQVEFGGYMVSKYAAVALAEWLAINYVDKGIGVSVLCPKGVRTRILEQLVGAESLIDVAQASDHGVVEPDYVADLCIEAMAEGRFLVLPHPEVLTYLQRKAGDYDRFLAGMRKRHKNFG